jgi:serine/threonine-protein kinase
MAPEQTRGAAPSTATDVFALGALVHEALTGRRAFAGPNLFAVLDQIRGVVPDRLAGDLPEPFRSVVAAALRPDPAARPTVAGILDLLAPPWSGPVL